MTLTPHREKELREEMAKQEHDRWARWQKYFFSQCEIKPQNQVGGMDDRYVYFALLKDRYNRWERQINTPYEKLSEEEKDSDRRETEPYLTIMKSEINKVLEGVEKETIICSAVEMGNGEIIRGHRHHNCINTARDIPRLKGIGVFNQGFITSQNRFVGRAEAYKIFVESGAISVDEAVHPMKNRDELYSEDLY